MFTKLKSFLAATLILAAGLSGATVALAENTPYQDKDGNLTGAYTGDPAQAAITKYFQMPKGTDVPDITFNFIATAKSVDGVTDDAGTAPELNTDEMTVTYPGGASATDGDTTTWTIETGDILEGVKFPHAGVYEYEITEQGPDKDGMGGPNPTVEANINHEALTYSGAKYTLYVYVDNNADGDGTYVYAIGNYITIPDSSNTLSGGDKIDPTPGGDGETYMYSQMIFTSTYVHTNGAADPDNPDPTNPDDSTLSVSKVVAGMLANTELYFNYSMTLTVPSLASDPGFYRAYVVQGDMVVTSTDNGTIGGTDNGGVYIKVSTSIPTAFSLKHGQKLVLVNTPVGTGYDVQELAPAGYTPSYIITTSDVAQAIPTEGVLGNGLDTGAQFVGELANKADFTNTRDLITPTGLSMNDLPFAGLIALGAIALIAFIAVRASRRNNNRGNSE